MCVVLDTLLSFAKVDEGCEKSCRGNEYVLSLLKCAMSRVRSISLRDHTLH